MSGLKLSLSEVVGQKRQKLHDVTSWNLKEIQTNLFIRGNRLKECRSKLVVFRREEGEKDKLGVVGLTDIYFTICKNR